MQKESGYANVEAMRVSSTGRRAQNSRLESRIPLSSPQVRLLGLCSSARPPSPNAGRSTSQDSDACGIHVGKLYLDDCHVAFRRKSWGWRTISNPSIITVPFAPPRDALLCTRRLISSYAVDGPPIRNRQGTEPVRAVMLPEGPSVSHCVTVCATEFASGSGR